MLKRVFDICASGPALIALSPLLVGLAICIKVTSRGPIFYRGIRAGRFGRPFRIYKYRSMVVNADQIGGSSTSDRDPRITRVGLLMRKFKLDELPQLFNVFLGDMSIVGPRPQVCDYVERYSEIERQVLSIRPGITDWASIWNSDEGAVLATYEDADAAYDQIIHPTKMMLQLRYAQDHSLAIDLKIILSTLLAMFRKDWLPADIADVPRLKPATPAGTLTAATPAAAPSTAFDTVTELPGFQATRDQLSMLHTRYAWAAEYARDKDVLEVACGSGIGLQSLASVANRVVGGDYDPQLVDISRQHNHDSIEVAAMDAHKLPYQDESFDVVVLLEAIYYLPDAKRFLQEARRVLRPGGNLLINSANCERRDFNPSPFSTRYFSAKELRQLLEAEGFDATLWAGFPTAPHGVVGKIQQSCREVAVKYHLIPKTMRWKAVIKRIFYGQLKRLPASLTIDSSMVEPLTALGNPAAVDNFKVLYAVGKRRAAQQTIAA